jgi:hypothetical protein
MCVKVGGAYSLITVCSYFGWVSIYTLEEYVEVFRLRYQCIGSTDIVLVTAGYFPEMALQRARSAVGADFCLAWSVHSLSVML